MKILLIAEHDQKNLSPLIYAAVTAAQVFAGEIDVLVAGSQMEAVIEQAKHLPVQSVLVANAPQYAHALAENMADLIASLGKKYAVILAASSTFSKNILPRAAALLEVGMLSDVVSIVAPDTFVRPQYAGNVLATVRTQEAIKVLTVRTPAFAAASPDATKIAKVVNVEPLPPHPGVQFVGQQLTVSKRPELTSARVIVSGGRGLKSAENFHLLEEIADLLGAAIGASRAAVDAGFAPNDYQVGQTGKVVAPDLYIAVGISGAIQHLAGMKDSKVIVAINSDPDAPIFKVADYVLVGDLFKVLPELKAALSG